MSRSLVENLSGLKINDAIELEDREDPISPSLQSKIELYQPITELDYLLAEQNSQCSFAMF